MERIIIAGFGDWFSFLGTAGLALVGYVTNRYVLPFLRVGKRQKHAAFIARIADDVTDELRASHPDKKWLAHLDEAVDMLIDIVGVSPEIARRAVKAAAARK